MRILGINAVFHDTAVALVVDGEVVFAAEEERFSRRKHGKRPVPYATWELPELGIAHALEAAGITAADLDLVGYSYDPRLVLPTSELDLGDPTTPSGPATSNAHPRRSRPRCPGWTAGRSASSRTTSRTPRPPPWPRRRPRARAAAASSPSTAAASGSLPSRAGTAAARWRCCTRRGCRSRWASSTRT